MSQVKPRKSAFSIYSENKSEVNTAVTNGGKKHKIPNESAHLNRNGAISKPSQKAKANKEQKGKFSKMNNDQLISSLKFLAAKQSKKPILPQSNSTAIKEKKTAKKSSPPTKVVKDLKKDAVFKLFTAKDHIDHHDDDTDSVEHDQNTDPEMFDSREEAINLLNHIINPIKSNKFFR